MKNNIITVASVSMSFILTCLAVGVHATVYSEVISEHSGKPVERTGFLWKPVSESTGNLVILTPHAKTFGKTLGHAILKGDFGTETAPLRHEHHNGKRPHFYFAQPGGAYGENVTVHVPLSDGSVYKIVIPNGAIRTER